MKQNHIVRMAAIAALCVAVAGLVACRIHAAPREPQAPVAAPAPMTVFAMPTAAPAGAAVLYGNKGDDLTANWFERYTTHEPHWIVNEQGVAKSDGHDITSKQEFGDCFVHAEWLEPTDANGKTQGEGNSGVGLQGRYEIQILDSFGQKPDIHGCGALYDEKAPLVVASKPPTEWQTYDILFRAPRFDADGKVVERPRATVWQNGILVQNNEEFPHMTGIQYGQYKEEAKAGPLVLQGDHDRVSFRNVWIVAL